MRTWLRLILQTAIFAFLGSAMVYGATAGTEQFQKAMARRTSSTTQATPSSKPAVSEFKATVTSSGQVKIAWPAHPKAVHYGIYEDVKSPVVVDKTHLVAVRDRSSYTDTNVTEGNTFYYTITSMNSDGSETILYSDQAVKIPRDDATP